MTVTARTVIVACPTCSAHSGDPCIDLTGTNTYLQAGYHPRRVQAMADVQASMEQTRRPGDPLSVVCPVPVCAAPVGQPCRNCSTGVPGEPIDFPHLPRTIMAGPHPSPESVSVPIHNSTGATVWDANGRPVTVELRLEKNVVVIDIDTNGDADVDMYEETLAVIRRGHPQDF